MATKTFYISDSVATGDTGPKLVESNSGISAANIGGYDLTGANLSGDGSDNNGRYAMYAYTSGGTNNAIFKQTGAGTSFLGLIGWSTNTGPESQGHDHCRTDVTYNGTFAAGTWTFDIAFTSAGSGGDTIFMYGRCWRSANANGSSATSISSAFNSASFDVTATSPLSFTWSNPSFSLTNEYLFVQFALSVNTDKPLSGTRITHRSSTTVQITTSNFTASGGGSLILDPNAHLRHLLIR